MSDEVNAEQKKRIEITPGLVGLFILVPLAIYVGVSGAYKYSTGGGKSDAVIEAASESRYVSEYGIAYSRLSFPDGTVCYSKAGYPNLDCNFENTKRGN